MLLWSFPVVVVSARPGRAPTALGLAPTLDSEGDCASDLPKCAELAATDEIKRKQLQQEYARDSTNPEWKTTAEEAAEDCEDNLGTLVGLIKSNVSEAWSFDTALNAMNNGYEQPECLKQILPVMNLSETQTDCGSCNDVQSGWRAGIDHCSCGFTLAHYAARENPEFLPMLQKAGANLSIADADGLGVTPAHLAVIRNRWKSGKDWMDSLLKLHEVGARARLRQG